LPAATGDDAWLEAFRAVVPAAVTAFEPDVLVTQLGCDTHATDPLAELRLTTRAYREAARELHRLAHAAAAGRRVPPRRGASPRDDRVRRDVRRVGPPRRAPRGLDRAGRAPRPRRGAGDPVRAGARPRRGRRGRARGRPRAPGDAGPVSARTKLVRTLGPASATPKMVQGLVRAGASVVMAAAPPTGRTTARPLIALAPEPTPD